MLAVGVLVLVVASGRQRLFSLLATLGVVVIALTFLPSFSGSLGAVVDERLSTRLESLTQLSGDASYQDRNDFLRKTLGTVESNPLGRGLGSTGAAARSAQGSAGISDFDNGWLNIPYTLGWVGAIAYLSGFYMFVGLRDGVRLLAMLPIAVGLFSSNILISTSGVAVIAYGLLVSRPREEAGLAGAEPPRDHEGRDR
jgi:hypothetical protein